MTKGGLLPAVSPGHQSPAHPAHAGALACAVGGRSKRTTSWHDLTSMPSSATAAAGGRVGQGVGSVRSSRAETSAGNQEGGRGGGGGIKHSYCSCTVVHPAIYRSNHASPERAPEVEMSRLSWPARKRRRMRDCSCKPWRARAPAVWQCPPVGAALPSEVAPCLAVPFDMPANLAFFTSSSCIHPFPPCLPGNQSQRCPACCQIP